MDHNVLESEVVLFEGMEDNSSGFEVYLICLCSPEGVSGFRGSSGSSTLFDASWPAVLKTALIAVKSSRQEFEACFDVSSPSCGALSRGSHPRVWYILRLHGAT